MNQVLDKPVASALAALREAFPLEQRLAAAPAPVRAAYSRILAHWHRCLAPPDPSLIDTRELAALLRLDAVVEQENGLGCYPFSADPSGYAVHVPRMATVFAFCAIDALAVPRLLGRPARIEARCASCGQPIEAELDGDGSPAGQGWYRTTVICPRGRPVAGPCCQRLCPAIRFMCATCACWSDDTVLALPQALVLANAFFAFQGAAGPGTRPVRQGEGGNV